jgi:excisionase family DNA binding protein
VAPWILQYLKNHRIAEPQDRRTTNNSKNSYNLLDVKEAAKFLGVTSGTLSVWICTKRYPIKSIKLGGLRRFREEDLIEFIESRICTTTVDPKPNQNPNSKNFKPSREDVL